MASNWRLTKKEIAHIAYALKELKAIYFPREVFGQEKFTEDELRAFSRRFELAANNDQSAQANIANANEVANK